jgi:hypothetical protein
VLHHLYRALASPVGIVLSSDNVDLDIQKLHKARRASGDPALKDLTIMVSRSNPHSEVWIAHQPKESVPDGE